MSCRKGGCVSSETSTHSTCVCWARCAVCVQHQGELLAGLHTPRALCSRAVYGPSALYEVSVITYKLLIVILRLADALFPDCCHPILSPTGSNHQCCVRDHCCPAPDSGALMMPVACGMCPAIAAAAAATHTHMHQMVSSGCGRCGKRCQYDSKAAMQPLRAKRERVSVSLSSIAAGWSAGSSRA